jgi:hypothetical protein
MATAAARRSSNGSVGSMAASAASVGAVSKAASTAASINDSLSGKTRKMVPSAMPAASAIWRVVMSTPWACRRGTTAATMAARRSEGGMGAARGVRAPAVGGASAAGIGVDIGSQGI